MQSLAANATSSHIHGEYMLTLESRCATIYFTMARSRALQAVLLALAVVELAMAAMTPMTPICNPSDLEWYEAELDFLALLKSRRTGSPSHNMLIDHIETELNTMGLKVYTDTLNFTYDSVMSPPMLNVDGQDIAVSSAVPYSGDTGPDGVSGPLINLIGPEQPPDWSKASGGIAVVNVTNSPLNQAAALELWPGSPEWGYAIGNPSFTSNTIVGNLSNATDAGVKGIVYVWDHISSGNAYGQYVPFHNPEMGCPALYVARASARAVVEAANRGANATLTLSGILVDNTPTRSIWTVVNGTQNAAEAVIINTHTDGTNVVEENGHIALLTKAKDLVMSPPKRTTILAFITGHIHTAAFSNTSRVTSRWLSDHPELWNGGPGQLQAVFASCVEHMGAVNWTEDLSKDLYYPTGKQEDEYLYAATQELATLVQQNWVGANPNLTRVINPNVGPVVQPGEGQPFLAVGIPEVSLVTSPSWLLKEWQDDFDERQLMDLCATKRQIDSFMRIWAAVDGMASGAFGTVPSQK